MFESYTQIYANIENEVIDLSYSISFHQKNIDTFSPKIADLILRSASLLESLIKYEYQSNIDSNDIPKKNKHIKYDDDEVLKTLNVIEIPAVVSLSIYNLNKNLFFPFKKNEKRVNSEFTNVKKIGKDNYSWNNAYQSLRHQFINSIEHYGTLYYLFETLSALYIMLNGHNRNPSKIFMTGQVSEDRKSIQGAISIGSGMSMMQTIEIQ